MLKPGLLGINFPHTYTDRQAHPNRRAANSVWTNHVCGVKWAGERPAYSNDGTNDYNPWLQHVVWLASMAATETARGVRCMDV